VLERKEWKVTGSCRKLYAYQVKEDNMGGTCSTDDRFEMCTDPRSKKRKGRTIW
jgi:hypothetical protein